ncbi:reverse transcriptase domain-containing protein [Tanacetum coccineum]
MVNVLNYQSGKSYDPPDNPNDQQNNSETPINFDSDDEDKEPTPQPKPKIPKPVKETPTPKPYKPKIPYPQCLRKEKMEAQYGKFLDMIRAVRINAPLVDVLAGMPNYGKFLKELVNNKHKIEQISAAFWSDKSFAILQEQSPIHIVPKKGGITVVTNEKDELVPTRTVTGWRVCIDYRKLNEATVKDHFPLPFMDQMLERLVGNKYFCFLDGFSGYFQILIDPMYQEKTMFTCPFGTYAYKRMPFGLCNAPATFQMCMLAIFHDMIEESIEVFMDDFSVFGSSFDHCLNNLDKMLQRCKDAHLVLNWEKCHFMVKEGIVLGHKVSKAGLKVDKAKIEVISKLPPPTNIKGPNWNLPFELMCDASDFAVGAILEFDIEIKERKGKENIAADHLSQIENDETSDDSEVNDNFPGEALMEINTEDEPWFTDFVNYLLQLLSDYYCLKDYADREEIKIDWRTRILTKISINFKEVIVNGDSPAIASASVGTEGPIPPKTAEQKLARKNELKAKCTMLLAIPDEHLLKFHRIKDAKTLWEAIKARFGGNKESKKLQKTIMKQQYENFAASRSEGLDKTYDRF